MEEPSPITSPCYFIPKKEGGDELRPIINYQQVNKWTKRDHNPIPSIKEAMEALQGKALFSKMDIRWGYNNIRIHPEDRYKAAIKMSFGTYHPTVMYFGLCNAPAFFQRTMQ